MFARGAFSLFLLLLSVSLPTHVQSQAVAVREVLTEYVEVEWKKQELWIGVDDYSVTFTSEGGAYCFKTITCTTVTCTFNSVQCGLVPPCTPTNVTVSGGEYTAPTISLITGPDKITELAPNITDGTLYVSWANPSTDSSPCYENTTVRIDYYDGESLSHFGHEEETTSKPLCRAGYGDFEIWTEGGDGRSNSSSFVIVYMGTYVVEMVTIEACKPVDCTAIEVEWSYVPVCPDAAYFRITMSRYITMDNSFSDSAPINSTSITMTDLIVDEGYYMEVTAMRGDGMALYTSYKEFCRTPDEVLENLTAEALNTSSLRVTWDPVACPREEPVIYRIRVDNEENYTTANEYTVGGLESFTEYTIQLMVIEDGSPRITEYTTSLTKAGSPNVEIERVLEDKIYVDWSFDDDPYDDYDFYYKLTWGEDLQHEEKTKDKNFIITDFNSTDEVFMVCVAAIPEGREDLASDSDCKNITDAKQRTEEPPKDGLSGGAIAGIVIGSVLGLTLLFGLFVSRSKYNNSNTRTQRTQQQQHGMQQQRMQEYKYGVYNPAASQ